MRRKAVVSCLACRASQHSPPAANTSGSASISKVIRTRHPHAKGRSWQADPGTGLLSRTSRKEDSISKPWMTRQVDRWWMAATERFSCFRCATWLASEASYGRPIMHLDIGSPRASDVGHFPSVGAIHVNHCQYSAFPETTWLQRISLDEMAPNSSHTFF